MRNYRGKTKILFKTLATGLWIRKVLDRDKMQRSSRKSMTSRTDKSENRTDDEGLIQIVKEWVRGRSHWRSEERTDLRWLRTPTSNLMWKQIFRKGTGVSGVFEKKEIWRYINFKLYTLYYFTNKYWYIYRV